MTGCSRCGRCSASAAEISFSHPMKDSQTLCGACVIDLHSFLESDKTIVTTLDKLEEEAQLLGGDE